MISKIKDILLGPIKQSKEGVAEPVDDEYRSKLAICALLLEIASFDGEFHDEEKKVIIELVKNRFGLKSDEVADLLELADKERSKSIDLWQFTKIINESHDKKEKIHLLEMLWEVIYADGHLHGHEDFLIHKLATLLKLEHKDLISTKIKVKNSK